MSPEAPDLAISRAPTETELKLRFDRADLKHILRSPILLERQLGERNEKQQNSTYFDTEDMILSATGAVLRIRAGGGKRVQTIKTQGKGIQGPAPERGEWEWEVTGDVPDLQPADRLDAETSSLILNAADRLTPIFTTDINRTEFRVNLPGGGIAVVAIDDGKVRAGTKNEPVTELELELEQGNVGGLYRLALELSGQLPLRISLETKSSVGFRLATGQAPSSVKARAVTLDRDVGVAEGIRLILQAAQAHLLDNQAPTLRSADIDGVHQMRVALRRLRAALALFDDLLPPDDAQWFDGALGDLARVFGEARDLDVLATELVPRLGKSRKHDSETRALSDAIEPLRSDAHARVVTEIGTRGYTRLMLSLAAWIAEEGFRSGSAERAGIFDTKLRKLAPDLLDRRHRAVLKRGKHIEGAAPEQRHSLRKATKKLRYGVEFLGSLYSAKKVDAYLNGLEELQDRLGELNDAAMAHALLPVIGRLQGDDVVGASMALENTLDKRADEDLKHLAGAWSHFKAAEPFWR